MEYVFSIGVFILSAGFLWFYIARPMLESFGVIRDEDVNTIEEAPPVVMSRSEGGNRRLSPSSLQTDNRQTTDSAARVLPPRDVMLNTYRLMRKYGIPREEARTALKVMGLPLDNNLWTEAAPPPPAPNDDDDVLVTPFAGRRTRASLYHPDEPELEYHPPR